jgi:MFS family permease
VSRPEEIGQHPDGVDPDPDPDGLAHRDIHWGTLAILRSRNFWVISLPFALTFAALSAILIHLVPYADDIGIPSYRAAWVLSVAAGAGVAGKLVFGRLVHRLDPRVAVWISFGTQIAGLLLIMQAPGYSGLLVGALVFGFGMGGVVPLQGALAGLAFGRLSFGEAMGLMRPVQMPIHVSGIPLAAWIHDTTGSYAAAWSIFLAVYVLAGAIVTGLRVPGGPRRPQATVVLSGSEPGLP